MSSNIIRVKTIGFGGRDDLVVDCGVWESGHTQDGVRLEHNADGSWIISYRDLKRIYLRATAVRKQPPRRAGGVHPVAASPQGEGREMNARDLCAPLELCRRIPEGKFGDSYFVWVQDKEGASKWVIPRNDIHRVVPRSIFSCRVLCPAPTLEEVIKAMDGEDCYQFFAGLSSPDDVTAATALEAWLEKEGA